MTDLPGPLFRYAPPRVSTHGDIAAGVGRDLGWDLDEQQLWLLDAIYAEDEDSLPVSSDVAIVGPRQTVGKTAVLEVAAITDISVFDVPLHVWTAHEFKTSRKAYLDMKGRLGRHPDYADRVTFRDAHGEEAIFFELGGSIEFHARSGGSGRGFTTSKITMDEALYLRAGDLGALVPTGVTMPDFQVRYGSSAGLLRSEALREIRERGRKPAADETLAYVEYGAPRRSCADPECEHRVGAVGCALDDRDLWWRANSGMWYRRVTIKAMVDQRRKLPAEEFAREFLSWWEDPKDDGVEVVFDIEVWKRRRDPLSRALGTVAIGLDVSPRGVAYLSAAGWRSDGRKHGELVWWGPAAAAVSVLMKVIDKVDPAVLVIDSRGKAASLLPDIRAKQIEPQILTTGERSQADEALVRDIETDAMRLPGEPMPEMETAVEVATWRESGDVRFFDRRGGGGSPAPLVSLSLARHGLLTVAAQPPKAPAQSPRVVKTVDVADLVGVGVGDLSNVGF